MTKVLPCVFVGDLPLTSIVQLTGSLNRHWFRGHSPLSLLMVDCSGSPVMTLGSRLRWDVRATITDEFDRCMPYSVNDWSVIENALAEEPACSNPFNPVAKRTPLHPRQRPA